MSFGKWIGGGADDDDDDDDDDDIISSASREKAKTVLELVPNPFDYINKICSNHLKKDFTRQRPQGYSVPHGLSK